LNIRREAGDTWIMFMKKMMQKMKLTRFSWLLLVIPLRMIMAEELPKPFSFARYQAMSDRSPFAVATTVAAPVEAPNFAKDLYIANAAQSKEGIFVTVASSTDRNFKKYLSTIAPVDGYGISNVEWSDKVGATKVTVTKDGQSATLSFNEALLHAPGAPGQNPSSPQAVAQQKQPDGKDPSAPNQAAASQGVVPMVPGTQPQPQPNTTKPMPVPALPAPPPRTRGVIPRSPTTSTAVKPAQPPQ
jgi:hypothetical protein